MGEDGANTEGRSGCCTCVRVCSVYITQVCIFGNFVLFCACFPVSTHGVAAFFTDDDPVGEGLVVGLDVQGPLEAVQGVLLVEVHVIHPGNLRPTTDKTSSSSHTAVQCTSGDMSFKGAVHQYPLVTDTVDRSVYMTNILKGHYTELLQGT